MKWALSHPKQCTEYRHDSSDGTLLRNYAVLQKQSYSAPLCYQCYRKISPRNPPSNLTATIPETYRSQWPLACWDCGFESRGGHGCLSVVCFAYLCNGPITSPDESYLLWCVYECLRKASTRRRPRLNDAIESWTKYTTNVARISPKDSQVTERSETFHGSHNVGCLIKCLVSAERQRKRKNGWKNEGMKENCQLVRLTSYTSASFHNSVVIIQHYLTKNTLKLPFWKLLKSKQKEMSNLYGICRWQERVLSLKLLIMLD